MDPVARSRALAGVNKRLRDQFPELDAVVVEAALRLAHVELVRSGSDFMPLLVEHLARARLGFARRDS
ncbi:three-helix bundle dimerization domain-containing protein [Terrabacter sp. AAH1]